VLAARQHIAEPCGEPGGMAAGELRGLATEPLGQRVRGLVDHLLRRRLIATPKTMRVELRCSAARSGS